MGSPGEFLTLFLEHQVEVRAFLGALVRDPHARDDDLFQEVALALWDEFDRYDRGRPFGAWARGVAAKKVLRRWEREARRPVPFAPEAIQALADALRERRVQSAAAAALTHPAPRPAARRWRWAAAAALLLAAGAAVGHRLARPVPPPQVVSGRVLIDGVEAVQVPEGARLEVAGDRAAVIRLPDGARAELGPESAAVLRGRRVVELGRGRGHFQAGQGPQRFQVDTAAGSVSARAAEFSVELQTAEEEEDEVGPMSQKGALLLVVAALVGQVEVQSAGKNYVLAAGQSRVFAADGKAPYQKPAFSGTVVAVARDGQSITLESAAAKPGAEPRRATFKLTDKTEYEYVNVDKSGDRPAVGYSASVWLEEGSADTARRVRLGLKEAVLTGKVGAVAADGKSFTLEVPAAKKDAGPTRVELRLAPHAKLVYQGVRDGRKPTAGYFARVWLKPGAKDVVSGVIFSGKEPAGVKAAQPAKGPAKKPAGSPAQQPGGKVGKPAPKEDGPEQKTDRDPAPATTAIDRAVEAWLAERRLPASPRADDAEFLRRVTLDLTGRVPTAKRVAEFLDSTDPDKRRKLIDELLASPHYGEHFATLWRHRLAPRDEANPKPRADVLSPWLARQFNRNRGWDQVVTDLLTAEGPVAQAPQSEFVLAQAESARPQPRLLADATARLFLGVQLRCAECHDHPFAKWKQADFWGLAAFFGRLRYTAGMKNVRGLPPSLTETDLPGADETPPPADGSLSVPAGAGKAARQVVRARFPGGAAPALVGAGPYRPRLAAWLTARDNPYFARAAANRLWAHLFARGLVHPPDGFDETNPPSHPALLKLLADAFAASGFDQKHLLRCVCNSHAYQRTSRPLPQNEADVTGLSRMNVKALSPEALYESLAVVLAADKNDRWVKPPTKSGKGPAAGVARDQFLRLFRRPDDAAPGEYSQGVPQLLWLLNGPALNAQAPLVDRLWNSGAGRPEAVEALFLAALARRPTAEEARVMSGYLERRAARVGYAGVLWALLNSGEFAVNH
jgi:DNA-directed RNA polymerase specialized sigma24 family protein